MSDTKATEYAEGLRALADMIEANPELAELLWFGIGHLDDSLNTREELATVVRAALKAGARVEKEIGNHFYATMFFGGIRLRVSIDREQVCEKVVTGTREVTEEIRDPEALAAIPMVTVTKVVEDVEWRCMPLLKDRTDELAGAAAS